MVDSCINHDEFVLVNNVLKAYDNERKESKILIIDKHVNLRKKFSGISNIKWIFTALNAQRLLKNNNIKIKSQINEKSNLCSPCTDCGFKKFETIEKGE